LPTLPKAATAPSLGPYAQYAEISGRPLFATDRRPHAFSLAAPNTPGADTPPDFDLVLTSVLITPQARLAIVQKPDGSEAWRVRVGEAPDAQPDWHLVDLHPRSAVFEGPGGRKELTLRVFDGKGGPAVETPPAAPPAAAPMAGSPMPVPKSMPTPPPAPPATDAAMLPDPAQIEQIRQRIEARREEMRRRAANTNPPATVGSPTPPANR
jgi:general secretion pathway protein N